MAMTRHPITGVEINVLSVFRPRNLDETEEETARLLRLAGHKIHDIAAMLGTNQGRIAEALKKSGITSEDPPEDDQPTLI